MTTTQTPMEDNEDTIGAVASTAGLGGWVKYNNEKRLEYPGRNTGRRLLLLIAAPDVAIYDFVASAHQDGYGQFWLGIPGQWLGPTGCYCGCKHGHIGNDWTVKAWMPAPEAGAFGGKPPNLEVRGTCAASCASSPAP